MQNPRLRIQTLLIFFALAVLLSAMPTLAALSDPSCGGYSYVACNGDLVTVVELCDGGIVKVTNGEVSIYSDWTWEVERAKKVEIHDSDGSLWVLEGDVQICHK